MTLNLNYIKIIEYVKSKWKNIYEKNLLNYLEKKWQKMGLTCRAKLLFYGIMTQESGKDKKIN
jgi:hypothetical protein